MSTAAMGLLHYVQQLDSLERSQAHSYYVNHFKAKAFALALSLLSTGAQ